MSRDAGRSVANGIFLPQRRAVRTSPIQLLLDALQRDPERDLLRWPGGGHMRVGEFFDRVCGWAAVLGEEGVSAGDRVASFCTNNAEFPALQYGTYAAGAVEVPVNAELRGPMLEAILRDCEPRLLIADAALS